MSTATACFSVAVDVCALGARALAQAVAYEAGGQGIAGGLINEQEISHGAAGGVILHGQFGLGLDGDMGDIVHNNGLRIINIRYAIEIQGAGKSSDAGLDQGGTIAQLEHLTRF